MRLFETLGSMMNPNININAVRNIAPQVFQVPHIPKKEVVDADPADVQEVKEEYHEVDSKLSAPYDVSPDAYGAIAKDLIAEIADRKYFEGKIQFDTEDISMILDATLIIYRNDDSEITEIVPVWWEIRARTEVGETSTDFTWRELYNYLQERF